MYIDKQCTKSNRILKLGDPGDHIEETWKLIAYSRAYDLICFVCKTPHDEHGRWFKIDEGLIQITPKRYIFTCEECRDLFLLNPLVYLT